MKRARHSIGWTLVLGWTFVAALLLLGSDWLFERIWALGPLLQGGWTLLGTILLIGLVIARQWLPGLVLAVAAVALLLLPLPEWGGRAWFWISFNQHREAYDSIVAEADVLPDGGQAHGVRYIIERGPPVRIAFPQPVGVADNWGAVIHDPSDGVATARGWGSRPGEHTIRADLHELWGGDLLTCSRITGHYYRCWFT